jgi:hypothetical protein
MKHNILHNKYVLYFIFLIAFTDFLLLAYNNEFYYVLIFCIVGYLTYQFSRNMIVILSMSVAVTNIFKYVSQATVSEGFEDEEEDIIQEVKVEDEGEEAEGEEEAGEKEGEKAEEKEKEKSKEKIDKVFSSLSLEKDKPEKEKFSQDKNVVYTSEDDLEIERNERKMMSQVKMLKTMNKYKPLLDTLQGITKNLAIVKGMATQ